MFRTILILAAVACLAVPVWAADDVDTQNSGVGGTIPELAQIGVSGDQSALMTVIQDGSGETAYDAGFIATATNGVILTLDANKKWGLGVHYSAVWTDPTGYDKAETDLTIQITNTPTGTIQNSFDAYHVVTGAKVSMLTHTAGVSDNTVNMQYKVLLDWTKDIPGVYSITLVYTMETTA